VILEKKRSWGTVRWIYLIAGVLTSAGAISLFIWPGEISPYLLSIAAILVLGVALGSSDEFLHRVHRVFWHREFPK
jgi:hypothetical protein